MYKLVSPLTYRAKVSDPKILDFTLFGPLKTINNSLYLPFDFFLFLGKGGPSLWTTFHRLRQIHQNIYKEDIRAIPELLQLAESYKSMDTNIEKAELNRLSLDEIKTFLTNQTIGNIDCLK